MSDDVNIIDASRQFMERRLLVENKRFFQEKIKPILDESTSGFLNHILNKTFERMLQSTRPTVTMKTLFYKFERDGVSFVEIRVLSEIFDPPFEMMNVSFRSLSEIELSRFSGMEIPSIKEQRDFTLQLGKIVEDALTLPHFGEFCYPFNFLCTFYLELLKVGFRPRWTTVELPTPFVNKPEALADIFTLYKASFIWHDYEVIVTLRPLTLKKVKQEI